MDAIPDVPEEIKIQAERTEFIVRKLIDKVADDRTDDVAGNAKVDDIVFHDYPLSHHHYHNANREELDTDYDDYSDI
jgi:hypothetical protein